MKKIIFSLFFLTTLPFSVISQTQLLVEDFNFNGFLKDNGWSIHSGSSTNELQTVTPGLSYSGYASSNIGNACRVGNQGGQDVNRGIAQQSGNGTKIFYSFLIKVTENATNKSGDYFIHIGNRSSETNFTSFSARVFVKIENDNVNFGLSNTSTAQYGTTNYSKNTVYLVVVKYTINTAGNDTTKLWVFSSGIPNSEIAAGNPEVTHTSTSGQDVINAIGIRQGSNTTQPEIIIDGIRIANTWEGIPLPVELISFKSLIINNKIKLSWQTATEINNMGWDIERKRIDEKSSDWKKIGFVAGAGNSNSIREYEFIDKSAVYGKYAYRLKQIDFDGKFEYSNEIEANLNFAPQNFELYAYPNPFNPSTNIRFSLPEASNVNISVYNMLGQIVTTLANGTYEAGSYEILFDANELRSGIYIALMKTDKASVSQKIMLIK